MLQVIAKPTKRGAQRARVSEAVESQLRRLNKETRYEIWIAFATNDGSIEELGERYRVWPSAIAEVVRSAYEEWGGQLHEVGYKAGVRSMTPPRWPGTGVRVAAKRAA